jgi:hypothetical protein
MSACDSETSSGMLPDVMRFLMSLFREPVTLAYEFRLLWLCVWQRVQLAAKKLAA